MDTSASRRHVSPKLAASLSPRSHGCGGIDDRAADFYVAPGFGEIWRRLSDLPPSLAQRAWIGALRWVGHDDLDGSLLLRDHTKIRDFSIWSRAPDGTSVAFLSPYRLHRLARSQSVERLRLSGQAAGFPDGEGRPGVEGAGGEAGGGDCREHRRVAEVGGDFAHQRGAADHADVEHHQ